MKSHTFQTLRACLAGLALAGLVLACTVALPQPAFALFNEPADSYPAAQELEGGGISIGEPVYAADLPEGQVLRVYARTTSRMCIMYENAVDCENQVNKEQALIMRSGDTIYVEFFMSKAYTYLYYPGTAEEAAALAPDANTPSPSYLAGDPSTGYVPHRFSISIPALNYPVTLAAYSGGNAERSMWYTRQAVFVPTPETYRVIEEAKTPATHTVTFTDGVGGVLATQEVAAGTAASAPAAPNREGYTFAGWDADFSNVTADVVVNALWEEVPASSDVPQDTGETNGEGDDTPGETPDNTGGNTESSKANDPQDSPSGGSNTAAPTVAENEPVVAQDSGSVAAGTTSVPSQAAEPRPATGTGTGAESSSSTDAGSSSSDEAASSSVEEEDASAPVPTAAAPTKRIGMRMTFAGFDIPDEGEGNVADVVVESVEQGLTPLQLVALALAGLLGMGALWRALSFLRAVG